MRGDLPGSTESLLELIESSTGMSAISLVSINAGFIIAADGLASEYDDASTPVDCNVQKIFEFHNKQSVLAYAISGLSESDDHVFNTYTQAEQILKSLSPVEFDDLHSFTTAFCNALTESLNDAKSKGHFPVWPQLPHAKKAANRWPLVQAVFVGYWNGQRGICLSELAHDGQTVKREFGFVLPFSRVPHHKLLGATIIEQATDPYRSDQRFIKYVKPFSEDMTLEAAEDFTVSRIEACRDPLALELDPACKRVGGHIHVAQITPDGFRWRRRPYPNKKPAISDGF